MDLNQIELPVKFVADLFQYSIVEMEEEKASGKKISDAKSNNNLDQNVTEITNGSPWNFLGGNDKNIMIILTSNEAVHLPDNELTFLTGVLGACKLNLADVAIVNLNNHPEATYKELVNFFKSKIVFLFDVEPASFGLPMNFPHYQIQAFAGNSFLYSPALKELENNKVEKGKLWKSLKRLFNL